MGCVWCRLLVAAHGGESSFSDPSRPLEIRVQGVVRNRDHWSPKDGQRINVTIDDRDVYEGVVHSVTDDPSAPYIVMRSRIRDVGSCRALKLARDCIDNYIHEHQQCCESSASASLRLPTRLIDCSADLARPRLVPTAGEHGEYLALSYVWGGDQTHKTTTSNISTYEQGIAPSLLPATIRDAIYVTHTLGFRWLWVDSLCIIQDSNEDKRHEIGRMHYIYRYAHLTIIAASAEHVNEGFLHERPPPSRMDFDNYKAGGEITVPFICPPTSVRDLADHPLQVGTVHITPAYSSQSKWPSTADLGRMGMRAWCMQEYLMSPRSLIFHAQTLYFRCLTATQSVGESFCSTYEERRIPDTLFLRDPLVAAPGSVEWIEVYRAWMRIVEDYSGRAASVESDKLVACAAVAEQFHAVLGSEYLAGLWRSDKLLADLLWDVRMRKQERRRTRPVAYRAPSWSWAAIEGAVRWNFPTWEDDGVVALAEIVECRVTLEDAALPFGQVTGGALVLRGTLIPCRAMRDPSYPEDPAEYRIALPSLEQARRLKWGLGGLGGDEDDVGSIELEHFANATIDCEADEGMGRMWAVPLLREQDWIRGMVLALASPPDDSGHAHEKIRFRRIGTFVSTSLRLLHDRGLEHPLWDPLIRAIGLKDGELPVAEIEII
ncbi:hypothetical protein VTO73DRAFT_15287 [Trametes versicolor]